MRLHLPKRRLRLFAELRKRQNHEAKHARIAGRASVDHGMHDAQAQRQVGEIPLQDRGPRALAGLRKILLWDL
jgi:hypothetical protein